MEMLMKPQLCVSSNATDDYLRYLRQMNISHCFVMFRNEETNYDAVNRTLERVRAAGLTVDDAGNGFLYKHPSIQLGLPDRDEWIAKYNDLNRWLGNAGVKVGYATWDTGRVSTSWWKAGEHTHGAVGRIVDMNEIYARKPAFGQEYDYDTMWNNFEYFLRAALPVCKEVGMKLALHPCDPPVRFYEPPRARACPRCPARRIPRRVAAATNPRAASKSAAPPGGSARRSCRSCAAAHARAPAQSRAG